MKKVVSLTLCALLFIAAFAGCGQKGLVTKFKSGWIGFKLSADECKDRINERIPTDSNKIGELKTSVNEGEKALSNMEKTVYYSYSNPDGACHFSIMEDGGENKVLSISSDLSTDEASPDAENTWKETNRAILRTALPKLSEQKCEEILSELGETDSASRTEGYKKSEEIDGVSITLRFTAEDPNKSYTENAMKLNVIPVQPTDK